MLLMVFFSLIGTFGFAQNQNSRLYIHLDTALNSDPKVIEWLGQKFELVLTSEIQEPIIENLVVESDSLTVFIKSEKMTREQKYFYSTGNTFYSKLWIGAGTLLTLVLLYFYRF